MKQKKSINNKCKCMIILFIAVEISMIVCGLVARGTISDYVSKKEISDYIQVAELPETFAISESKQMKSDLPKSNIIMKATATGRIQYEYDCFQQEITVEKVYKGDDKLEKETIWVMKPSWSVWGDFARETSRNYQGLYVEIGFANYMKKGRKYLLFLDKKADTSAVKEKREIYTFSEDILITPIFCYEKIQNVIAPADEEFTYVLYSKVKDNEFFSTSKKGIEAMEDLKYEMIKKFL